MRAHFGAMAAMNPRSTDRPRRRTVAVVLGGAVAVALALVVVSLLRANTSNTPPATENPVVDLAGIPQDGRVLGSPEVRVTLVEYADPQCPGCRSYTETIFPVVVNEYVRPGKVKTEFRGYPFLGNDSVKAYRFFLAAALQNKLWNLQEAMYRHQGKENSGWVTDDLIRRLAEGIAGLSVNRLFSDAERSDIREAADNAADEASAAGIQGTPTFLIQIVSAPAYLIQVGSAQDMRAALDDAISS
jgi:protein-disulfide isomerase